MLFNCIICGKEFKRWGKGVEQTAKTCSTKCKLISRVPKPNTKCTHCGTIFHMKNSQKIRGARTHGHFCSRQCANEFREIGYAGELNPNFKGESGKAYDKAGYKYIWNSETGKIKAHHKVAFD